MTEQEVEYVLNLQHTLTSAKRALKLIRGSLEQSGALTGSCEDMLDSLCIQLTSAIWSSPEQLAGGKEVEST